MLKTNTMTKAHVHSPATSSGTEYLLAIPWCQSFSSRPALVWENLALCHSTLGQSHTSTLTQQSPYVMDSEDIYKVLAEIYPSKSLLDIYDLLIFMQQQNKDFSAVELSSAYGFFWNETHEELLLRYPLLPEEFQSWAKNKSLNLNDLRPLILLSLEELKEDSFWGEFLNLLVTRKASYGEGKTLLELAVDLYLIQKSAIELSSADAKSTVQWLALDVKDNATWISRLRKLRYPMTVDMEQSYKNFVEKHRWPLQCQFKRQGDKKGFVLSTFIGAEGDIKKAESQMQQSLELLKSFYQDQQK